jgi:3-hydroxyacyl-[acyl-carrier-protein] dehydratase
MVLIDRVLSLEAGRSLTAVKAVSGSEPCYADLPADAEAASYSYPVALIIESFGQAAAMLWSRSMPMADGSVAMFAAARDVRVTGAVYPGDVMRHTVTMEHVSDGVAMASGYTTVDDRRVATFGSMTAVLRPRQVLGISDNEGEHHD